MYKDPELQRLYEEGTMRLAIDNKRMLQEQLRALQERAGTTGDVKELCLLFREMRAIMAQFSPVGYASVESPLPEG